MNVGLCGLHAQVDDPGLGGVIPGTIAQPPRGVHLNFHSVVSSADLMSQRARYRATAHHSKRQRTPIGFRVFQRVKLVVPDEISCTLAQHPGLGAKPRLSNDQRNRDQRQPAVGCCRQALEFEAYSEERAGLLRLMR